MPDTFEPSTLTDDPSTATQVRVANTPFQWPQLPPWLAAVLLLTGGGAGGFGADWLGTQALQDEIEDLRDEVKAMKSDHDTKARALADAVRDLTETVEETNDLVNAIHPDPRTIRGTP